MQIITEHLNGKRTIEDLADTIIRLEKEVNRLKLEKTNKSHSSQFNLTTDEHGIICDISFVNGSYVENFTQLKLNSVPTINQKLFIHIKGKVGVLFNVIDVVNGIEIDKENKEVRQTIMVFVEEVLKKEGD